MIIDKSEVNGFTVLIEHDEDPDSPRNWTVGADLVMWGRNYNFPNDAGISLDDFSGWDAVAAELEASHDALVTAPVWVYEHSGIALSTGPRTYPFDDRWDSAQAGVAYVTRKNWADTQGTEWTGSEADTEQAHQLIASEVEVYGQYLSGDVYSYVVQDFDGETVDSCCGLYGYDYAVAEGKAAAEAAKHEDKCHGELNRSTGTIDHAGACPKCGCTKDEGTD